MSYGCEEALAVRDELRMAKLEIEKLQDRVRALEEQVNTLSERVASGDDLSKWTR